MLGDIEKVAVDIGAAGFRVGAVVGALFAVVSGNEVSSGCVEGIPVCCVALRSIF